MFGVYKRFIKDRGISLTIYVLSTIAFLEMYVALFPGIRAQADKINELLKLYPKALFQAFGMDPSKLSFSTVESFIATEHYSLVWPIILIILVISMANAAISAEVEKGTAEILLAQPISRIKFFFSRYFAGATLISIFVVTSILAIVPLAAAHNVPLQLKNNLTLTASGLLFGLAIFSIAMFSSAIFSEKSRAAFISSGVILTMYVANILAGLKDNLSDLKYGSFFYYFNGTSALVDNQYVQNAVWVFLGVSVLATLLAAVWFVNRDVSV